MTIQEQLNADLKSAMLERRADAVSTLRMVKSEIKNTEISQGTELDENAVIQLLRKEVKKRREASELYKKSGSPDKAASENFEAELLEKYLPAQTSPQDIEDFIDALLQEHPEFISSNKGDVIKATLGHFKGQADGRIVSELVNKHLQ